MSLPSQGWWRDSKPTGAVVEARQDAAPRFQQSKRLFVTQTRHHSSNTWALHGNYVTHEGLRCFCCYCPLLLLPPAVTAPAFPVTVRHACRGLGLYPSRHGGYWRAEEGSL